MVHFRSKISSWMRWVLLCTAIAPAWAEMTTPEEGMRRYAIVPLEADLSGLTPREKSMLPLLREAAQAMEAVFWRQSYGDPEALFSLPWSPAARQLLQINFGPWDRLEGNRPLLPGIAPKPPGGRYYPPDLSKADLEAAAQKQPALTDPFTLVRRDEQGTLQAVPYHQAFAPWHTLAADRLQRAAALSEEEGLARYLRLRAEGLRTDHYRASDMAWMEMKENRLDLIIGPIETYEDGLLGVKAAHEALLLLKDRSWDARLARYTQRLSTYQSRLPTPAAYRTETPGLESDLGVYDLLQMNGDAAATRPIAINLPNDEQVQLAKGSRRLQLRNAMRTKFDTILYPMAQELLDPQQWPQVTFAALFANTLFHEVAHGLGIKQTINGKGRVTDALQEDAWMMEEGKADALALWLGDLDATLETEGSEDASVPAEQRYLTEFASLFRSIRFGASSAHARANVIRFNYLREKGAFTRNATGRYRVDLARMKAASAELAQHLLRLQGDGDAPGVRALEQQYGKRDEALLADLRRMEGAGIPFDVVFQ
ncbi:MAG: Zn-dependent hydrolase, partial [Magnetococcales bacterium]|nr:Zn-dependent hydrolase [Magnetococcales bacterium]